MRDNTVISRAESIWRKSPGAGIKPRFTLAWQPSCRLEDRYRVDPAGAMDTDLLRRVKGSGPGRVALRPAPRSRT